MSLLLYIVNTGPYILHLIPETSYDSAGVNCLAKVASQMRCKNIATLNHVNCMWLCIPTGAQSTSWNGIYVGKGGQQMKKTKNPIPFSKQLLRQTTRLKYLPPATVGWHSSSKVTCMQLPNQDYTQYRHKQEESQLITARKKKEAFYVFKIKPSTIHVPGNM